MLLMLFQLFLLAMYQCIVPTLLSISNIHVVACMTYNICIYVYIILWVLGFLCELREG